MTTHKNQALLNYQRYTLEDIFNAVRKMESIETATFLSEEQKLDI